jgi:hypothetical protein
MLPARIMGSNLLSMWKWRASEIRTITLQSTSTYSQHILLLPKLALRVVDTILPINSNMRIVLLLPINFGELDSDVIVALAAL